MFQMGTDGSFGYEECRGCLSPVEALSYEAKHLNLPIGEPSRPFFLAAPLSVGAICPAQVIHESLESIVREPAPYLIAHHVNRLIQLAAWTVGRIVSKLVKAISHGDNLSPHRYLGAPKPAIVAAAIHSLVMCRHDWENWL